MAKKEGKTYEKDEVVTLASLSEQTLKQIYTYARQYKIPNYSKMTKKELSLAVVRAQGESKGYFPVEGVLDITGPEFGFLYPINYSASQEDIYISSTQINRFGLRNGDLIKGLARPPKERERRNGLLQIATVNGKDPELAKERDHFPALTPIYPDRLMKLETDADKLSLRMIDLLSPIGFGQRGLIAAPPKAGKTVLLKQVANAIATNYPEVVLIVLLIDERPEEVTDFERNVQAEVVASTFDQHPRNHIQVAELVIERAKRLVEDKQDVVVLIDSLTRLVRAYNNVEPPSGRTMSGGLDPVALNGPKKIFGSARNIEGGGSLTILATALIQTDSKADEVIYEEFKGTGNMELHLERSLAQSRIFPAIDVNKSGTRKEDLLLDTQTLEAAYNLRQLMTGNLKEDTRQLLMTFESIVSNQELIEKILVKKGKK